MKSAKTKKRNKAKTKQGRSACHARAKKSRRMVESLHEILPPHRRP